MKLKNNLFFFPTSIFSFGIEKKRTRTLQAAFIPSVPLTTKLLERTQNCPHCLSRLHFNYWRQTTYEEIGEVGRRDRITQTSPTGCKRQPDKNPWMFLHTSDVWSTLTPNWLWSSFNSIHRAREKWDDADHFPTENIVLNYTNF